MPHVVEKQKAVDVERSTEPHVGVMSVEKCKRLVPGQREHHDGRELVAEAREQVRADLAERAFTPP